MSVTTTANPTTYTLQATLKDYELHHSGTSASAPPVNPNPAPRVSNPSDWDSSHRRVPNYRPINTNLDQEQRRVYLSNAERTFVAVMFTGVFIEAVGDIWWNATDSYEKIDGGVDLLTWNAIDSGQDLESDGWTALSKPVQMGCWG
jgi:SRSO17 transposase